MHEIADIACNFTSDRFDNDLDEVIDRAIANHITKFGLICSRLRDIDKLLEIYNRYSKNMFFTIGVHPHHANEINAEYLEKLKDVINKNNPHAIGETGLDFFRNFSDECREKNCENPATTLGYCRLHYISNWKTIKKNEAILKEGKLQDFIEDLVKKYPVKEIEGVVNDLSDEKTFFKVLKDLDIDSGDEASEFIDDDLSDDDQDIAFETKVMKPSNFFEE